MQGGALFMRLGVNFARSYTHWQNETYDRLVEQARRVMDQRQRLAPPHRHRPDGGGRERRGLRRRSD
jgi:hypothetical protein